MLGFGGRIRCFRGTGSATRVRSARRLPISFLIFLVWLLFDPSRRRPHSLARQRRAIKHLASLAQDRSQLHVAAALIAPNGFICCFQDYRYAQRYQTVLPKRLDRFSLEVAEDKTKLIRFGRFAREDRSSAGAPETFDFLGFTHYCGLSRAGKFKLKRKTSGKKMRVKLREIRVWFYHQLSTAVGERCGKR